MADVWYYLKEDNTKIIRHWENDGLDYLEDGPEASETEMTIEQFLASPFNEDYPDHREIIEKLIKHSIIKKCECIKGYHVLKT